VGEVSAALSRAGVERDTLFLFSSDNGPWFQGSPGRLRGRKGMTWEGGVRVPFIARFPGRIPEGKVSSALLSALDVTPTVSKLCGGALPNPVDGVDVWPVLAGTAASAERDVLLYFDDVHLQCARRGRWKVHLARYNHAAYSPAPPGGRRCFLLPKPELYDLERDADESYDVSAEHPEIVADLAARAEKVMAGMPEPVLQAWTGLKALRNVETRSGAFAREY
jgi:arylsulfatase